MANTETEFKLRFLDPGCWEQVFASATITELGDPLSIRQETLEAKYYDTPSRRLQKARLAFRIRRERGVWLATVKNGGVNAGGLHQREEWVVTITEPVPTIAAFMDTPVGPILAETVGDEELVTLFTTHFERQIINLHTIDGSIIELAADRGEICAGDHQSPILEIELELKAGNEGSILQLAADLAREFPLLPEWRSKYFRALQLAGLADDDEIPVPAYPLISGTEAAGAALAKLMIFSIHGVLAAQERFLQFPEDPESLHQVRIHLRRLRSLLSFGKSFIPQEMYVRYRDMLQELAVRLGSLRETDVALGAWHEVVASTTVQFSVKPVLGDKLVEKRTDLVAQIHKVLHNGQATPQLLDMWAWLVNSEGLSQSTQEEAVEISVQPPLIEYSREKLNSWLISMFKNGKNIDVQDDELIHTLRIRGKKVRYVLESLALIWPNKTGKMIERLKAVQDSMGYLHDLHTTNLLLQDLLRAQSSRLLYRDIGVLLGWQAHKVQDVRRKLKKQWKRLRRIEQV